MMENFSKSRDFKANSRFVALNEKSRGISRNSANFAIFRGRRKISRFRTCFDKFLSLTNFSVGPWGPMPFGWVLAKNVYPYIWDSWYFKGHFGHNLAKCHYFLIFISTIKLYISLQFSAQISYVAFMIKKPPKTHKNGHISKWALWKISLTFSSITQIQRHFEDAPWFFHTSYRWGSAKN